MLSFQTPTPKPSARNSMPTVLHWTWSWLGSVLDLKVHECTESSLPFEEFRELDYPFPYHDIASGNLKLNLNIEIGTDVVSAELWAWDHIWDRTSHITRMVIDKKKRDFFSVRVRVVTIVFESFLWKVRKDTRIVGSSRIWLRAHDCIQIIFCGKIGRAHVWTPVTP